jgi:hypothetical protein
MPLNSFQIRFLEGLNSFYPNYMFSSVFTHSWLPQNLLYTEDDTRRWIDVLEHCEFVETENAARASISYIPDGLVSIYSNDRYRITSKGREYLHYLSMRKIMFQEPTAYAEKLEEGDPLRKMVDQHLSILAGRWMGTRILNSDEYATLVACVYEFIKTGKVPKKIKKVPRRTTISFEFIRKTFHFIYLENGKTPIVPMWADLLLALFDCGTSKTTIVSNFSTIRCNYETLKSEIILD